MTPYNLISYAFVQLQNAVNLETSVTQLFVDDTFEKRLFQCFLSSVQVLPKKLKCSILYALKLNSALNKYGFPPLIVLPGSPRAIKGWET